MTVDAIWDQCGGEEDAFVMGAGTGGTIAGVSKVYLNIYICTHIAFFLYIYECMYTFIYMYVCAYMYIYICIYIYLYICIYISGRICDGSGHWRHYCWSL